MRRFILLLLLVVFPTSNFVVKGTDSEERVAVSENYQLYLELGLSGLVDYNGFEQAMVGYKKITNRKKDMLILIDFTKPSDKERMFIIDMKARQVLIATYVAHGKGSGDKYATSFSNKSGSAKSSLGFYITEDSYNGRSGYSLRLDGIEAGINDHARQRGVVIHGAQYCDPDFIANSGRLGRSQGCPAVPTEINDEVIEVGRGGALVYIYANDKNYISQSDILSDYSPNRSSIM